MRIYLDLRTNEIVKDVDPILSPELYFVYELGETPDIVIERYELPNGDRLDYSYSVSMRKYMTKEVEEYKRSMFLKEHCNGNKITEFKLLSIVIPKDVFIQYCTEGGLDDYVAILESGV